MRRTYPALTTGRSRWLMGTHGAAAVELAVAISLLAMVAVGVADYGVLMGDADSLESATRAGAEVAKLNPTVSASTLTSLGLFPSGVTATVTAVCTCVDNSWPSRASCPPGPVDTPCAGKTNPFVTGNLVDPRVFQYVQITATQNFSPMVSYASFGFPSSLTGQAFTRNQ
jgi:Flp pilus assembly protein TadG